MTNKKSLTKLKAFSLIEISIVIVIIGLLIAGITQGSRLVAASRLSSAQSLTNSSDVRSITGLALWLETTLSDSLVTGITTNTSSDSMDLDDGNLIKTWKDINPQSSLKLNANAIGNDNRRPTYVRSGINGLPVLRFDGANNYFLFDGTILLNTSYTIIAVEQRRASGVQFYIGGDGGGINQAFHMGYISGTTIRNGQYGSPGTNLLDSVISNFSNITPRIHAFMLNTSSGKYYWLDGSVTPSASTTDKTVLTSYVNAAIGHAETNYYYNGDIAEIIIFNRALKTDERKDVEKYLSKKWGIKLN